MSCSYKSLMMMRMLSCSFWGLFGIGVLALCDFLMLFDHVGQMGFHRTNNAGLFLQFYFLRYDQLILEFECV